MPYITLVNKISAIYGYNPCMGFAENVRSELEFQDIQIKELALRTGISRNTLDKYLFGKKVQPGVENAVKIARVLGVSVEYLSLGDASLGEGAQNAVPEEFRKFFLQYKKLNAFNKKTVEDLLASLSSRQ